MLHASLGMGEGYRTDPRGLNSSDPYLSNTFERESKPWGARIYLERLPALREHLVPVFLQLSGTTFIAMNWIDVKEGSYPSCSGHF